MNKIRLAGGGGAGGSLEAPHILKRKLLILIAIKLLLPGFSSFIYTYVHIDNNNNIFS